MILIVAFSNLQFDQFVSYSQFGFRNFNFQIPNNNSFQQIRTSLFWFFSPKQSDLLKVYKILKCVWIILQLSQNDIHTTDENKAISQKPFGQTTLDSQYFSQLLPESAK